MSRAWNNLGAAIAVSVTMVIALPVLAEEDHLIGYKSKDDYKVLPSQSAFTFTSGTHGTDTCEFKKVLFHLFPVEKEGGDDPRGGPAGEFVCYKVKCNGSFGSINPDLDTQFGLIGLLGKKAKIACLPAVVPTFPPVPTPTATATPTPSGPQACEATTGGLCWFLGGGGQSCDQVCLGAGRVYDSATATYAGSGGSDAHCAAVMTALGVTDPFIPGFCDSNSVTDPIGCVFLPQSGFGALAMRCSLATTTSGGAVGIVQRACACL